MSGLGVYHDRCGGSARLDGEALFWTSTVYTCSWWRTGTLTSSFSSLCLQVTTTFVAHLHVGRKEVRLYLKFVKKYNSRLNGINVFFLFPSMLSKKISSCLYGRAEWYRPKIISFHFKTEWQYVNIYLCFYKTGQVWDCVSEALSSKLTVIKQNAKTRVSRPFEIIQLLC